MLLPTQIIHKPSPDWKRATVELHAEDRIDLF